MHLHCSAALEVVVQAVHYLREVQVAHLATQHAQVPIVPTVIMGVQDVGVAPNQVKLSPVATVGKIIIAVQHALVHTVAFIWCNPLLEKYPLEEHLIKVHLSKERPIKVQLVQINHLVLSFELD